MTRFTLNGVEVSSASHPLTRLLDVLRDELRDLSLKEGCGEGECGACSVLLDGRLANACLLPLGRADGCTVVTMAGVRETPRGKALVEAFAREGAVQCGFCTPGLVMAAEALLSADPAPDGEAIRAGLSGNLCRCTGYEAVVRAVAAAAREGRGRW
ncbi:MAG: ferredoxin [Spirochaetes bacterium RBG_13_68_11]|nr:MAG: ferredoxin [Spirochaetes bacterium RBG_13_68_11]